MIPKYARPIAPLAAQYPGVQAANVSAAAVLLGPIFCG